MKKVCVLFNDVGWPIQTVDWDDAISENPKPDWKMMTLQEYDVYCRDLRNNVLNVQAIIQENQNAIAEQNVENQQALVIQEPQKKRGRPKKSFEG